ncbi:basic proline-rich protein-like [Lepus europaeus]|uniref:basic proline-rich protein-like n=1 Tax=Lepus europaeus TaxID=9983 RepID=UPI002B45AAF0|nr:basic proline-rich protein-like [Lepus europaeus]
MHRGRYGDPSVGVLTPHLPTGPQRDTRTKGSDYRQHSRQTGRDPPHTCQRRRGGHSTKAWDNLSRLRDGGTECGATAERGPGRARGPARRGERPRSESERGGDAQKRSQPRGTQIRPRQPRRGAALSRPRTGLKLQTPRRALTLAPGDGSRDPRSRPRQGSRGAARGPKVRRPENRMQGPVPRAAGAHRCRRPAALPWNNAGNSVARAAEAVVRGHGRGSRRAPQTFFCFYFCAARSRPLPVPGPAPGPWEPAPPRAGSPSPPGRGCRSRPRRPGSRTRRFARNKDAARRGADSGPAPAPGETMTRPRGAPACSARSGQSRRGRVRARRGRGAPDAPGRLPAPGVDAAEIPSRKIPRAQGTGEGPRPRGRCRGRGPPPPPPPPRPAPPGLGDGAGPGSRQPPPGGRPPGPGRGRARWAAAPAPPAAPRAARTMSGAAYLGPHGARAASAAAAAPARGWPRPLGERCVRRVRAAPRLAAPARPSVRPSGRRAPPRPLQPRPRARAPPADPDPAPGARPAAADWPAPPPAAAAAPAPPPRPGSARRVREGPRGGGGGARPPGRTAEVRAALAAHCGKPPSPGRRAVPRAVVRAARSGWRGAPTGGASAGPSTRGAAPTASRRRPRARSADLLCAPRKLRHFASSPGRAARAPVPSGRGAGLSGACWAGGAAVRGSGRAGPRSRLLLARPREGSAQSAQRPGGPCAGEAFVAPGGGGEVTKTAPPGLPFSPAVRTSPQSSLPADLGEEGAGPWTPGPRRRLRLSDWLPSQGPGAVLTSTGRTTSHLGGRVPRFPGCLSLRTSQSRSPGIFVGVTVMQNPAPVWEGLR